MTKTVARWDDNILMVSWFGLGEDKAAFWHEKTNTLYFDGNEETFSKRYPEKPDAHKALEDITRWQLAG